MFEPADIRTKFPDLESEILRFWEIHGILDLSLNKPSFRGDYVFYEGPPTANGKPGLHHVSARAFKDLFPRYKTMSGYRVHRRGGWDTHGLPVEVEVEKQIGSTGKADIERFGVAKFNALCRESVFRYIQDWNALTQRIGFWIDLDNAYITYSNSYIESCWWILKNFWDRGLLYRDYKVTMHCPRCNTSLADHEVALGMKEDVEDPSVWPKFRAHRDGLIAAGVLDPNEERPVSFLAWTTTPWTLGANVALAVCGSAQYALVEAPSRHAMKSGEAASELYILASTRLAATFGSADISVLKEFQGSVLVGLKYDQLMSGKVADGDEIALGFRVIADPVVSLEDGTGIVHIAPAYGDLEVGKRHRLPTLFSVDLRGRLMSEVRLVGKADGVSGVAGPYENIFFKEGDKLIIRDLSRIGLIYRSERLKHAYPFCWRDDTPLLFFAKNSWYVATTAVKERLIKNNLEINWIPASIKAGRFGKWLENNVDWAISRERFWGCPLPIWETEDGSDRICVGSMEELCALAGRDLRDQDLHRPFLDEISFTRNGQTYHRVPYTIDVWFESGAMPYAQWHYPFENQELFRRSFPGDFICEAADQTRGWFYSLHAIAAMLTETGGGEVATDTQAALRRSPGPLAELAPDSPAFRNCLVLGLITDAQGRKMSKSRGNAIDPWHILQNQGADALRWYMFTSGPADQNKAFEIVQVTDVVRNFLLTLWNTYCFFVLYARIDQPDLTSSLSMAERPDNDRWLLSKLYTVIVRVTDQLDQYNATTASRAIQEFVVNDLSNWYIRNNRRRFWKSGNDIDKLSAYLTLHETLLTLAKLLAPMIPFISEAIYQNLKHALNTTAPLSVHLCDWPVVDASLIDVALLNDMGVVLRVIEMGRSARSTSKLRVRQPLQHVAIGIANDGQRRALERLKDVVLSELNVKEMVFLDPDASFLSYSLRPNLPLVGRRLGRDISLFRKALETIDVETAISNIRRGLPTPIVLGDRTVEFEPEAFLVDVKSPDSFAAIEQGGVVVALNTQLTESLLVEGRSREFVHHLQNARKNAGFDVTDHIELGVQAVELLAAAIRQAEPYIRQEAMVTTLVYDALEDSDHIEVVEIDSAMATITLKRMTRSATS